MLFQFHAACCPPRPVRCYGYAQSLRCHRLEHWGCPRRRPRHCSRLQRRTGMLIFLNLAVGHLTIPLRVRNMRYLNPGAVMLQVISWVQTVPTQLPWSLVPRWCFVTSGESCLYIWFKTAFDYANSRLDSIANSIASATFDVINEGKVRTADMGGKLFLGQGDELSFIHNLGSATTSDFTAAILKRL